MDSDGFMKVRKGKKFRKSRKCGISDCDDEYLHEISLKCIEQTMNRAILKMAYSNSWFVYSFIIFFMYLLLSIQLFQLLSVIVSYSV